MPVLFFVKLGQIKEGGIWKKFRIRKIGPDYRPILPIIKLGIWGLTSGGRAGGRFLYRVKVTLFQLELGAALT